MIFFLKIAFKFHQGYKKNIFISLVSIISVVSITIGIAVAIITLSIINGFEYELNKRVLSIIPHGEIIPTNYPFTNWKYVLHKVKKMPDIITAHPYINFFGVVEFNNKWNLVYIKSINLVKNSRDSHIINFIENQSWKYFCEHKNQIILGQGIANTLNVTIGDWVNILFVHDHNVINRCTSPKKIRVQVSGILNLNSQFDDNLAIISLSDAKNYFDNRVDVDGIEIVINNVFQVNQIVKKIKNEFDEYVQVRSWIDTYNYIYQDIQTIRLIIYLSVILIIGISCFNVIATLILSIKNKSYDIVILRALGVQNIFIQYIFLWHGLIIYCISSIFGMGIGMLISLNLTSISSRYIDIVGKNFFPERIYFIDFIPSLFSKLDAYIVLSIVFVFGLLISWYTSLQTNQIKLTNILK